MYDWKKKNKTNVPGIRQSSGVNLVSVIMLLAWNVVACSGAHVGVA